MSSDHASRPPLSVCFGGGGAYAYGFGMGIAKGLLSEGIDLRSAPMIGTSAGAHVVASLSASRSFEDIAPFWANLADSVKRPLWIRASDMTEPAYGHLSGRNVAGVAVRVLTFRRTLLWADDHRLADLVAASASVCPIARPHRIDGRRYIDGGHRRVASADLAPDADLQLLVTAFARKEQGLVGRMGGRQAAKEQRVWSERTGGKVLQIGPVDEMLAVKVKGVRALGDVDIARRIHALAVPVGRAAAAKLRDEFPDVVARLAMATAQPSSRSDDA